MEVEAMHDVTNYDQIAETIAILAQLLQTGKLTAQSHWLAVQALELLTLAVEEYEEGL